MNTKRSLVVTADDYGLSQSISDSILETVDAGSVTNLSIMPNGMAFQYALNEAQKRKTAVSLSIHLNLTEGKSLTHAPLLTHDNGYFKYSVVMLAIVFLFSRDKTKLVDQIRSEIRTQIHKVIEEAKKYSISVASINGHQHVHMLPFVSAIVQEESFDIPVRVPREFFSIARIRDVFELPFRFPRWWLVQVLPKKFTKEFSDIFVGLLYSGDMTFGRVQASLQRANELPHASVEVLFHPGSGVTGELKTFCLRKNGERWHYSEKRKKEKNVLLSDKFLELKNSFLNSALSENRFMEIVRFGIAGGISTSTNLLLLIIFTELFGFWYVGSAIVAYCIAIGVSFTLQKFWAFAHHDTTHVRAEVGWYILNNVLGIVFDAVGLLILVEHIGMWYMTAQFILLALIATWNFFIYRFVIFKVNKKTI